MSSAYDMFPQAFRIFFGSDLESPWCILAAAASHSGVSLFTLTPFSFSGVVGIETGMPAGSGRGQVLERDLESPPPLASKAVERSIV